MNWIYFLTYTILCAYTPGPNNIIVMSSAANHGFRRSFALFLGICSGFMSVMILCSFFSVALANFIPAVEPVMKYLGGIYILYLAWQVLMSNKKNDKRNGCESDFNINTFKSGFFLQFINIKIILYGITAITTFVMPYDNSMENIFLFTFILTFIGWSGTFIWMFFGMVFNRYLERYSRTVNYILASMLGYSSLTLIF